MLDQAVHLAHASAGGNQHQRPVGQLGQVGVAKRHFNARQAISPQLVDQLHRTGLTRQHMQLQFTPGMWRGRQRESCLLAALTFDHQVLPRVITQRFTGRRTQAHPPDVAADVDALTDAARQLAHWQLAQGKHTVPEQHAVLQRFGNAGEQLAMVADFAILANPSFNQQRGANMAIAIAAAVWAVIAQPPCSIQDPFPGFKRQHRPGRLQRYLHQSIPN